MRVGDIRALLNRERYEALSVRDPIAIDKASERYTVLDTVLAPLPENEVLDLYKPMLSVSQTARLLGYKPKEIRNSSARAKSPARK